MKLKGLTKLVLAGTALAATAATLTTSTYAWYVTNSKVEATGVSGATAGDSVAGSLLISEVDGASAAGLPLNYTTKIALNTSSSASLVPQSKAVSEGYFKSVDAAKVNGKTYYTRTGDAEPYTYTAVEATDVTITNKDTNPYYEKSQWVDKDGKYIEGTLVSFSFWLKASDTMNNIAIKTVVSNDTTTPIADNKKQTFYNSTAIPSGKHTGDLYCIDAVYALRMEVVQQAYTLTKGATANDDLKAAFKVKAVTTDTFTALKATLYKKSGNEYTKLADGDTFDANEVYYEAITPTTTTVGLAENHSATAGSTYASPAAFDTRDAAADANQYFKAVMKYAPYGTTGFGAEDQTADTVTGASTDLNTTWTSINLEKNVDTLLTFSIWLEGTDRDCWDSCVGQDFSINLYFNYAG